MPAHKKMKGTITMKLLFVCTGNTCRSPMAEAICKYLVKQNGLDYEVASAGVLADDGNAATYNSIEAVKNYYDLSNHRSQYSGYELMEKQDKIITMTPDHTEYILKLYPEFKEKLITFDVGDPYGQSLEVYQKTADMLYTNIEKLIDEL